MPEAAKSDPPAPPKRFWFLSLAALGVVYGDIGTSPLYAVRESFSGHYGVAPDAGNILGVLSLILWSLVLVVSVKYLGVVLRADNNGEGGILALTALITPDESGDGDARSRNLRGPLVLIGIFGAALLYGDGMLTPVISVLGAMEGIRVAAPELSGLVVPGTIAVLALLFFAQRRGTASVGALFGPLTLVWFLALAALGLRGILLNPSVLAAVNPTYAANFLLAGGLHGFLVLGAVFLVVTGSEALYADLGHFGKSPIRLAWFAVAFPALLLNYFGQGALILADPAATVSPFYLLAPAWAVVPLIVLATVATIIASQAIITGVFSLTMQAVQLGLWPRLEIRHTSATEYGQIYVPTINWTLMVGTIALVLTFRSSAAIAGAYALAIIGTMIVTTLLLYVVAPSRFGWNPAVSALVLSLFLVLELAFLGANVAKFLEGGWVPLALAGGIFILMVTWWDVRENVGRRLQKELVPLPKFLEEMTAKAVTRVRGNAVYMTGNPKVTPTALVKNLEHQRTLHTTIVLLSVRFERVPYIRLGARLSLEYLGRGFHHAVARYGFLEVPNVPRLLELFSERGMPLPLKETTFFLGRERVVPKKGPWPLRWRTHIFSFMSRNSQRATAFFRIPPDRVVEVGSQVEI
ncbi:MAG: potassium transporter Kup [Euryarchaeota archaeon]|nr:potassium transporter Kup [Euryarchaeota archaeon]